MVYSVTPTGFGHKGSGGSKSDKAIARADMAGLVDSGRRMSPRLDMIDCETVLQMADAIEALAAERKASVAAALELAAEEQQRKADHWMKRAHEIGAGDGRHPADGRVAGHLSAEASIRAMIAADASAALDRIKAEAEAEGMRIGAAREKMRALTEWLNEDEDNGELLMASLDGDTIETLRAILAAIPVTK